MVIFNVSKRITREVKLFVVTMTHIAQQHVNTGTTVYMYTSVRYRILLIMSCTVAISKRWQPLLYCSACYMYIPHHTNKDPEVRVNVTPLGRLGQLNIRTVNTEPKRVRYVRNLCSICGTPLTVCHSYTTTPSIIDQCWYWPTSRYIYHRPALWWYHVYIHTLSIGYSGILQISGWAGKKIR